MNSSPLLIPIIDTCQSAARVLIAALEALKATMMVHDPRCEHIKRSDESTSGVKRWRCLDCGHIEEKEII